MCLKGFWFSLGCTITWFVLLPAFIVGCASALIFYAVIAELTASLMGNTKDPIDASAAREMARRICLG
jgi:hypothetical protein